MFVRTLAFFALLATVAVVVVNASREETFMFTCVHGIVTNSTDETEINVTPEDVAEKKQLYSFLMNEAVVAWKGHYESKLPGCTFDPEAYKIVDCDPFQPPDDADETWEPRAVEAKGCGTFEYGCAGSDDIDVCCSPGYTAAYYTTCDSPCAFEPGSVLSTGEDKFDFGSVYVEALKTICDVYARLDEETIEIEGNTTEVITNDTEAVASDTTADTDYKVKYDFCYNTAMQCGDFEGGLLATV